MFNLCAYTLYMASNELRQKVKAIIQSTDVGVSFSIKNCREYGIDWELALADTLALGFKRFRLMSYWDEHEQEQGIRDFSALKRQINNITNSGGRVTLCLGMRQPRWPETHIPAWAKLLSTDETAAAYLDYQQAVIEAFKNEPCIESWQLENEFWLKSFGEHFDFSRDRLKKEFNQVRLLDPARPIIMSLSDTLGIPIGQPKPDIYATSVYRNIYTNGQYITTKTKPWYYGLRGHIISLITRRPFIIHELQTEPWGPQANWLMTDEEQAKSMNAQQIQAALEYAHKTGISYIDIWGAEWWFWRKTTRNDTTMVATLQGVNNKNIA
jgi:hypothetical protein